jgi:cell division protein FtsI (penicillin-binding protein 3)
MIMKKSSNICTAKVGFKLGRQGLYSRLRAFGFGNRTGIRLRGERAGILRTPGGWSDVGLANIAFGQGMTTTVLQLAQALTAVANGGVMMRPRLVQRLTDSRGRPVEDFPPRGKRVISAGTARHMLRMLRGVTEEGGTGVDAALERYSVAGKTGTAQKVDPVTRTYSPDLWVSSFAGVVPVRQPRLVIVVVVNEPEGDRYYGGEVAGPIFKHIAGKALAYLGVRPDRRPVQAVAGHRDPAAVVRAAPVALPGVALLSSPAPQLPGGSGRAGSLLVPDFTGMSIAEVLAASRKLGLRVRLMGSGVAVAQSPGPGPTPSHTLCRVSFRPPG